MPGEGRKKKGEGPRTDLPPKKDPYYRGYFGTDEEEGVVREREAGGRKGERSSSGEPPERTGGAEEDAAGGDREI